MQNRSALSCAVAWCVLPEATNRISNYSVEVYLTAMGSEDVSGGKKHETLETVICRITIQVRQEVMVTVINSQSVYFYVIRTIC